MSASPRGSPPEQVRRRAEIAAPRARPPPSGPVYRRVTPACALSHHRPPPGRSGGRTCRGRRHLRAEAGHAAARHGTSNHRRPTHPLTSPERCGRSDSASKSTASRRNRHYRLECVSAQASVVRNLEHTVPPRTSYCRACYAGTDPEAIRKAQPVAQRVPCPPVKTIKAPAPSGSPGNAW